MTVYLDIIWALNFMFDSLLLYLTAIILKREIRLWRIFAGGLIGSIIILLVFTPFNEFSGHPVTKLLFSVAMVLAVFGFKRLRYFLKGLMTFYFATFLVGGSLIGIHYFINFDFQLSSSVMLASVKGFGDPISWLFVLLGFPLAWHFSKRNVEGIEMTKIQYDSLIMVRVVINETEFRFRGLIDSGNQLYDPISKMPVMFISIKDRLDEFPPEIIKMAGNPEDIIMGSDSIGGNWEHKMRVIPCKVVGQEHQLIIGFKPDRILLEKENEIIESERGLVSFSMQQLSADDAFQCIVHPKMLTGTSTMKQDAKVS
ncbi:MULTISPECIES: sigma-E processing peptidase SpoIIGA [Cytobacillus]|uniref:Sigma-E processing peptidase SpoIIGA n=3 Tax=Cytobacillus TaxID=2675230 RepID=A0A160M9G3_9BACI|nr:MULTISPECIES: sigma-E processing peptidase SpoIIGA [Cytobacillus]EFV79498.1 sporulation factor SpoIIGA [Bacillus sp. 2_A_57_CT2]MCS0822955.1 sigma-E processing peptidase SpoIIGA [Cytobacillus firmus]AND39302.1 sigma-E processing peptidase SpoIIGA [Cytobacillus oceanisediminis 2691]MBU8732863.1 sigma-E processing peptidase SpoIIGA [Cytobacillus oceanisediminis]MBU8768489.1 sigma-E processing peptidase SpoIIGA [Cytobacillus oceanisediminis]